VATGAPSCSYVAIYPLQILFGYKSHDIPRIAAFYPHVGFHAQSDEKLHRFPWFLYVFVMGFIPGFYAPVVFIGL